MRNLNLSNKARDLLKDLQAKPFKQVTMGILELTQSPQPHGSKALKGYNGLFRKDSGEYRIVYRYDDSSIYVSYPVGLKGVIIWQSDSYEAALMDVKSAIALHIETFGKDVLNIEEPVLEVFLAETAIAA